MSENSQLWPACGARWAVTPGSVRGRVGMGWRGEDGPMTVETFSFSLSFIIYNKHILKAALVLGHSYDILHRQFL